MSYKIIGDIIKSQSNMRKIKEETMNNDEGTNEYTCDDGVILVNTTPHDINVLDDDNNELFSITGCKSLGIEAPRLEQDEKEIGELCGVKLYEKKNKEITNLPPKKDNTYYIVSLMIASNSDRDDLIVPNTIRDNSGRIIGCDSFTKVK